MTQDVDTEDYFEYRCRKGLEERGRGSDEIYIKRLEYEMGVIKQMGFCGYFLVVSDFITWGKKNDILIGGGRGSSAGSICAYSLKITNVDPIEYGLLFERFLNPGRTGSPPDIDVDFEKDKRDLVIDYVRQKYGSDQVSQIGTIGTMKAKQAIQKVCSALGYDREVGEKLRKLCLPPIHGKPQSLAKSIEDVKELNTFVRNQNSAEGQILNWARRFEDRVASVGVHASGIVISPTPICSKVPLYQAKNANATTQWGMGTVEEAGFIKFDFLGLMTLSKVRTCLDLIQERYGSHIELDAIPLDDEATFKFLQQGELSSIFQLETSSGMRDLVIKVRPEKLEDLAAIVAIYRPGPLQSNGLKDYLAWRAGAPAKYLVPELGKILQETGGFCVFQEQIIRIAQELAGYSLSEADLLRKAMGKKKLDVLLKEKTKFRAGWLARNLPEDKFDVLWEQLQGFADYAFNKCLSGDTIVERGISNQYYRPLTIEHLYKTRYDDGYVKSNHLKPLHDKLRTYGFGKILAYDKDGKIRPRPIKDIYYNGPKETYTVTFSDGSTVRATKDHKFLGPDGFVKIKDFVPNVTVIFADGGGEVGLVTVSSVAYYGVEDTYDIEMDTEEHNFIANGIVTSNSHAVSYALLTYQTAWLKTHYPIEFITSCMIRDCNDVNQMVKYIGECRRMGVKILPPSVNRSRENFSIEPDGIRFGLVPVKGIGEAPAGEILKERTLNGDFKSLQDFCQRIILAPKTSSNAKTIEVLVRSGAFDEFGQSRASMLLWTDLFAGWRVENKAYLSKVKTFEKKQTKYQERLAQIQQENKKLKPLKEPTCPEAPEMPKMPIAEELSDAALTEDEHSLLGIFITGHPLKDYVVRDSIELLKELPNGSQVQLLSIVAAFKEHTIAKTGKKMAFCVLEDMTGQIEAVLFPRIYEKFSHLLNKPLTPIAIEGTTEVTETENGDSAVKLVITSVATVSQVHENKKKLYDLSVNAMDCSSIVPLLSPVREGRQALLEVTFKSGLIARIKVPLNLKDEAVIPHTLIKA